MFRQRINTYLSVLCITIIGGGAALLIVHVSSAVSDEATLARAGDPLNGIANLNLEVHHSRPQ